MKFYKFDAKGLEKELETDIENGLTGDEAKKRFKECGYNSQYTNTKFSLKSLNAIFLSVTLVIVAAYLIFALFNKDVTYVYNSIVALAIMLVCQISLVILRRIFKRKMYMSVLNKPYKLKVIRDGEEHLLKYSEIMYGDIVIIQKGDYIPFDGIVISSNGLVTDESDVTGNDRVSKHVGIIPDDNVNADQLFNTVFCGSYVVHGTAKVIVTDICARVYIIKSGKNKTYKFSNSTKIVDISSLYTSLFSLFCIIFTVICGLISHDFPSIIIGVLLFVAVLTSGFMKSYSSLVFKKAFLNLNNKGIYIKSVSQIETLETSDIVLLDHNIIFDNSIEVSGFISNDMKLNNVSSVDKSNFNTFLYSAFCLLQDNPLYNASVKMLKKVGVEFSDLDAMCPLLSRANIDDETSICARAYNGNNMIIAVGNYKKISLMCQNHVEESEISALNKKSSDLIAVCIKNVDIIPNDLSVISNDFTLIGVIGINKKTSVDILEKCQNLKELGTHPIILFPGNIAAAISTFGSEKNFLNINCLFDSSKNDIKSIDCLCEYDGDINKIVSYLSKKGHVPSYYGDKVLRDNKCVSFKSVDMSAYNNKDSDVVTTGDFDSLYSSIIESKKATYLINDVFGNFGLISAFYIVCGVLFSLLYNEVMLSSLMISFLVFVIMPMIMLRLLITNVSTYMLVNNKSSFDLLHNKNFSFGIVSIILFLLICVILKFISKAEIASAVLSITFISYLSFSSGEIMHKPNRSIISLLPAVFLFIVYVTPVSAIFGIGMLSFWIGIVSIILGVLFKILSKIICRSVKI